MGILRTLDNISADHDRLIIVDIERDNRLYIHFTGANFSAHTAIDRWYCKRRVVVKFSVTFVTRLLT